MSRQRVKLGSTSMAVCLSVCLPGEQEAAHTEGRMTSGWGASFQTQCMEQTRLVCTPKQPSPALGSALNKLTAAFPAQCLSAVRPNEFSAPVRTGQHAGNDGETPVDCKRGCFVFTSLEFLNLDVFSNYAKAMVAALWVIYQHPCILNESPTSIY